MPAKKATRNAGRTTRQSVKRPAQPRAQRTMTAAHKKALAEGRAMSLTVDRYLAVVNTTEAPGPQGVACHARTTPGPCTRNARKTATGVDKVLAAQEIRDLEAKIARGTSPRAARTSRRGYAAWRDAGVSAQVLRRAGVARTWG